MLPILCSTPPLRLLRQSGHLTRSLEESLMSAKMLLINPGPKKKRRSRGRMPPGLAAYWAGKRRGKKRRPATNPRRKSRARRNPRLSQLFSKQNIKSTVFDPVIAAGIGGAAAVALDVGLAYLPLPDAIKDSAIAQNVLKLAGAIALGYGASKVMGKERGRLVTTGALTVAAYGAIRDGIKRMLPEDLKAKVKGLGGIADYVDYEVPTTMGMLQYRPGVPLRGGLGLIEQNSAQLGGSFDPAFENSFSGIDD
jgi:hypothetical protein